MLVYFTNHSGNQFQESSRNILPCCSKIDEDDYSFIIQLLSKKVFRMSEEKIRYYANLAWLYSSLTHSLNAYEMTIQ